MHGQQNNKKKIHFSWFYLLLCISILAALLMVL